MENYEEEIKKFDALEMGVDSSDPEAAAIQKTDELFRSVENAELSSEFTQRVFSSGFAYVLKKRRRKFFLILGSVFISFMSVIFILAFSQPSAASTFELSPDFIQLDVLTQWMANEKNAPAFDDCAGDNPITYCGSIR